MDTFSKFLSCLAAVPAWVPFVLLPLAVSVLAVLFARLGARRLYPVFAFGFCGLGGALVASFGGATAAAVYCGLSAAFYALCSLFLLLPPAKKKKRESREERIYRKFRVETEPAPPPDSLPPKICCYEEPATAEESGMRLAYALSLIAKLKGCKLTPADRLELEALGHALDGCRGKLLAPGELSGLNDTLAAVLKLTAKYKL